MAWTQVFHACLYAMNQKFARYTCYETKTIRSKSTADLSARSSLCDSLRSECCYDNITASARRERNIGTTTTTTNSCDGSPKASIALPTDISQPTTAWRQFPSEPSPSCTNGNPVSEGNLFVVHSKRDNHSQRMRERVFGRLFFVRSTKSSNDTLNNSTMLQSRMRAHSPRICRPLLFNTWCSKKCASPISYVSSLLLQI